MKKDIIEEQLQLGEKTIYNSEALDIATICEKEINQDHLKDKNATELKKLLSELPNILIDENKRNECFISIKNYLNDLEALRRIKEIEKRTPILLKENDIIETLLSRINDEMLEIIKDVLLDPKYLQTRTYLHHNSKSAHVHSLEVYSKATDEALMKNLDVKSVANGSLLHDYYLYDWHITDVLELLIPEITKAKISDYHCFSHGYLAADLARADFKNIVDDKVYNIISSHMAFVNMFFKDKPVDIRKHMSKEAYLVSKWDMLSSYNILLNLYSNTGMKIMFDKLKNSNKRKK